METMAPHSTIPVATAQLVGTFVETFGYGVYLTIFPRCMAIFWHRYKDRKGRIGSSAAVYFMVTMILLLLVITVHIVTNLTRVFQAFTANISVGSAAEVYFKNGDTSLNMLKVASNVTVTLIGDLVMLYRTAIIWRKTCWVMMLPASLFIVDIAMSAWHTWSVAEAEPDSSILYSATYQRSLYFFAATLAFNLVCTILIGFKLWRTRQDLKFVEDLDKYRYYGVDHQHVTKTIAILLESAAIYTVALVCMIGTALVHYSAYFILYNSMPPLVGSVFSFIILRSAVQEEQNDSRTECSSRVGSLSSGMHGRTSWPLRPVQPPLRTYVAPPWHAVAQERMPGNVWERYMFQLH